jgi:hypothetical protein
MKTVLLAVFCAAGANLGISTVNAADHDQGGSVTVYAVNGSAKCSTGDSDSKPLKPGDQVPAGCTITTDDKSTVDLVPCGGSAFRVNPGSELDVKKCDSTLCGDQYVNDCDFNLKSGSLTGCTGKQPKSSKFCIDNNNGHNHCNCNDTQYLVLANGDVTVLSGKISVDYDPTGKKKSDQNNVMVSAGETFDPKTGEVVPTTAKELKKDLKKAIADITTMQDIADSFKVKGATITVFSEQECSPVKPPCDNDHDHDHNHDHDHDHDKDGQDHGDQGHGKGHDGNSGPGYY